MTSDKTIVLITGVNRGIGKEFLRTYLTRPNHTVIAANRDSGHPTSKALHDLPKASGSTLIVVKIDATRREDAAEAIVQLGNHGINHLDIVIANAGICQTWPLVSELDTEYMQKHLIPNVYGVIWLYQATLPLLNKSPSTPKWVSIGSGAGTLTGMAALPFPNAAYGPTKVALHWLTAKMHFEEAKLITLPMDPGFVQTDMGNYGARHFGMEKAYTTVEESVEGMIKVVDIATKLEHSGKLFVWTGKQAPW